MWRYLCSYASAVLLIWTLSSSPSSFPLIHTSHTLRKATNEHIDAANFYLFFWADNASTKLVLCFYKRGDKHTLFLLAYKLYLMVYLLYECVLSLEEEEEKKHTLFTPQRGIDLHSGCYKQDRCIYALQPCNKHTVIRVRNQRDTFSIGGQAPCSRVPWQCFKNVLAPLLPVFLFFFFLPGLHPSDSLPNPYTLSYHCPSFCSER